MKIAIPDRLRRDGLFDRLLSRRGAGRRIVGLIGNEGAIFVRFFRGRIADRRYLPAPDAEGLAALREMLADDPKAPVKLLLDVLEQHYRETEVPRINLYDRHRMFKRRLRQTFEADHLTAYLPVARRALSHQAESEQKSRRGRRTALLIGVPPAEEISGWIDAVLAAGNPSEGMALLPVEAQRFIRALRPSGTARPEWEVIILRHRASGYRQVVLYQGTLVFTRLTPNLDPEETVRDEVEAIEGEFRSTMSYLRRLSFTESDRLELTVVAPREVGERLDAQRMRVNALHPLTPAGLAERLGLDAATYADDVFSDSVFAEWYAHQRLPRLHLEPPPLQRARWIGFAPKPIAAATGVVAAAAAASVTGMVLDLQERAEDLAVLEARHGELKAAYSRAERALAALKGDPERFVLTVRAQAALGGAVPVYAPVVRTLAEALPDDMVVTDLRLRPVESDLGALPDRTVELIGNDPTAAPSNGLEAPPPGQGRTVATVRLHRAPPDRRAIMQRFAALTQRLDARLDGYSVRLDEAPFAVDETGSLTGGGGLSGDGGLGERITGQYTITGPLP